MEYIGTHLGREAYWIDYEEMTNEENLPSGDWIWFAIANTKFDEKKFKEISRKAIDNGLLEFKGQGKMGSNLHGSFDLVMVDLEIDEGYSVIDIMTTGDDDSNLTNSFWECFCATCLPAKTNYDNLKILCADLNGKDRKNELKVNIERFNENWIPEA
jgi:hypothetical protein